jgi:hypothetical protein
MSTTASDTTVRPAATWYLVTAVLWIAALVVAVIAWKPIIDIVRDGVDPIRNHGQISVSSAGLTVYAIDQSRRTGSCLLVDSSGKSIALQAFDSNFSWKVEGDGRSFKGLGSTPSGLPPGNYELSCTGMAPTAELGTGPRISIGDVTRIALLGVVVPAILGLAGLVVLIVLLVKRHNSKSRIKAAQAYAAGGGYPGGWQSGGYPPQPPPPPPRT